MLCCVVLSFVFCVALLCFVVFCILCCFVLFCVLLCFVVLCCVTNKRNPGRSGGGRRNSARVTGGGKSGSGGKVLKSFRSGIRKSTRVELMTENEIAKKFHTKLIAQAQDIEETQVLYSVLCCVVLCCVVC